MASSTADRVFDPICGMWLEAEQVAVSSTYLGQTYSFCCEECRDLFRRDPEMCVELLAHEPNVCMAHRCPFQRRVVPESTPAG